MEFWRRIALHAKLKKSLIMKKGVSFFVALNFILSCIMPPEGFAGTLSALGLMPHPGTMVSLSSSFTPAHLWGMTIHPKDPFKFDFLVHRGDSALDAAQKKAEYTKLIKYFLAALAVPDKDQWVNLSPYEKDRIIPDDFGLTEMGRDLLAQDYLLKQLTSSLTDPDSELGKKFWDKVYKEAFQKFGTTNIPTDTFNKVWIVPDKAVVYEKSETVYVLENHLKVMLESDYLAAQKSGTLDVGRKTSNVERLTSNQSADLQNLAKQIFREILLPALEIEVNTGKSFAPLRQVYSGMLLATWYKRTLKESILGKLYADKEKVNGLKWQEAGSMKPEANGKALASSFPLQASRPEMIWEQYVQAFKKGVFSLIREDVDRYTQEVIPRKYFSGGTKSFVDIDLAQGTPEDERRVNGKNIPLTDVVVAAVEQLASGQRQAITTNATAADLEKLFQRQYKDIILPFDKQGKQVRVLRYVAVQQLTREERQEAIRHLRSEEWALKKDGGYSSLFIALKDEVVEILDGRRDPERALEYRLALTDEGKVLAIQEFYREWAMVGKLLVCSTAQRQGLAREMTAAVFSYYLDRFPGLSVFHVSDPIHVGTHKLAEEFAASVFINVDGRIDLIDQLWDRPIKVLRGKAKSFVDDQRRAVREAVSKYGRVGVLAPLAALSTDAIGIVPPSAAMTTLKEELARKFLGEIEAAEPKSGAGYRFMDVIRAWEKSGELWKLFPELEPVVRNRGGTGHGAHPTALAHIFMVCDMLQAILNNDYETFKNGGWAEIWQPISGANFQKLHEFAVQAVAKHGLFSYILAGLLHDAGKAIDVFSRHVVLGRPTAGKFMGYLPLTDSQRESLLAHVEMHSDIARLLTFGEVGAQDDFSKIDMDWLIVMIAADTRSARPAGWLRDELIEAWFTLRDPQELAKKRQDWEFRRLDLWSLDPTAKDIPGRREAMREAFDRQYQKDEKFREFMRDAKLTGYYAFHQLTPESFLKLCLLYYHLHNEVSVHPMYFGLNNEDKVAVQNLERFFSGLTDQEILAAEVTFKEEDSGGGKITVLGKTIVLHPEGDVDARALGQANAAMSFDKARLGSKRITGAVMAGILGLSSAGVGAFPFLKRPSDGKRLSLQAPSSEASAVVKAGVADRVNLTAEHIFKLNMLGIAIEGETPETVTIEIKQADPDLTAEEARDLVADSLDMERDSVRVDDFYFYSGDNSARVTLHFDRTLAVDGAMRGGIDFAQSNLDMQIRRDGNGVPLPVDQQDLEHIKIDGLVPVILDIHSATAQQN